jgi:hypothetical protein
MRADIHDGPERKRLQSKAGYIDARPHIRQPEEVLLQRTAGPYIWVIRDRGGRGHTSVYVLAVADPVYKAPVHRDASPPIRPLSCDIR